MSAVEHGFSKPNIASKSKEEKTTKEGTTQSAKERLLFCKCTC